MRIKFVDVRGLPQDSRTDFRSRIVTLKKFCEKLVLLEHVRLRLSCDMHVKSIMEEPSLLAFPARCRKLSLFVGGTAVSDAFRRCVAVASWTIVDREHAPIK
ncbi:hypothetical protein AAVH_42147 [Aphelenchoides avenae]|nr:hypothetical protein AAVH_42147 [Aphelenchus avenae]